MDVKVLTVLAAVLIAAAGQTCGTYVNVICSSSSPDIDNQYQQRVGNILMKQ